MDTLQVTQEVAPCRAVVFPVGGAPWPNPDPCNRDGVFGTRPLKEKVATMPGARQRLLEAEARMKSGPVVGAGDACRHPDSKYFDRLLMCAQICDTL